MKQNFIQPNSFVIGHVLTALKLLRPESIQCVVTSPPYWGMRSYKAGLNVSWPDKLPIPFGAEPKPETYLDRSRLVLSELKPRLKKNGVIWWNLGDTYFTRAIIRESSSERLAAFEGRRKDTWKDAPHKRYSSGHSYLKDKDLTLIPFLVAYEAQKLGYWVRSMIVWEKPNLVPEPRIDRPVLSHEYILMLTNSKTYKWNKNTARERSVKEEKTQRLLRSVWSMATSNGGNGHPASFPEKLVERCIMLSTRKNDLVFDPFMGSGTTALVANKLGRKFIGVDIVSSYLHIAAQRVRNQDETIDIKVSRIKSK